MRSTPESRDAAHRAVVAARQALRFEILLRDRDGYLAAIGQTSALSEEEIALADLVLDPKCAALALATPAERRDLDAACWHAVKEHLGLVRRIAGGSLLKRFALDPDMAEGLILDGLAEAIATWDPSRAALGTYAAMKIYSRARSWTLGERRRNGGPERVDAIADEREAASDPLLSAAVERALLGLDLEERELVATVLDPEALGDLARARGVAAHGLRNRRRELLDHLRRAVARDASLRRMRRAAIGV